ncbi:MAG TPA: TolC family protein, partial [Pirellula sp.]|nr:TolC family protein [Pirellula sp.]
PNQGSFFEMLDTVKMKRLCSGLFILLAVVLNIGCNPRDYRQNADRETYRILTQKTADPRWSVNSLNVVPQGNSRFSDPFDPDRPPMPPDDPTAHRDMHCPGGIPGYRRWHKDGNAAWIENPAWREVLPLNEDGSLDLTQENAIELALLNSREYQTELENLYLNCLALTLQRFEFNLQWFLLSSTDFFHFGSSPNETNSFNQFGRFGFRKAFAGGGQIIASFSNSLVYQFAGTDSVKVRSNIGVDLVQPLLRNAGRNVRLESLTQAERNVFYAARDFARFRKQFYFDVTARNSGYLALLERIQNIRNFEANLLALEVNYNAHKELNAAGLVSRLQMDQVFQGFQIGRLSLVQAQNGFNTELDLYKIRLGLPPDIPVKLDESLLNPFQFADRDVQRAQLKLTQLLVNFRENETLPGTESLSRGYDLLAEQQKEIESLVEAMPNEIAAATTPLKEGASTDEKGWHTYRTETLQEAEARLIDMTKELKKLSIGTLNSIREMRAGAQKEDSEILQQYIQKYLGLLSELDVTMTRVRAYHIELQPVDISSTDAIEIALNNRLDLLNRQAQVVDSWRNIQISANRLKGFLDLTVNGDIATEVNSEHPFDFSSSASGYRTGVRFDAPLNRYAERNAYRAQLIQYQRFRRTFMAVQDQVVREIRRDFRNLETSRINFEITRQSLITAARQVEEATDQLVLPGPASDSSHTQDSLNALNILLQSKNALIKIWADYASTRVQLLLDLEALQPDPAKEPAAFYFDPPPKFSQ